MASRKAQALIRAARANDSSALLELGRLYLDGGEGLAPNPSAAFHWLSRAMAGDCCEAAALIADRIPPEAAAADYAAYAQACMGAARRGSTLARRRLGELMLAGLGVTADRVAALAAFRTAAEGGDAIAACRLGGLLATEPNSLAEARRWLEQAARRGNTAACHLLADLLWQEERDASLPWMRIAAESGDVEAACRLGEWLADQQGNAAAEGAGWLARAADQGHARARWRYGRLLAGSSRGLKRAARLLEQAAAGGIAEAWWDLARLYDQRRFTGRDMARARQCLETAARLNVREAQLELGRFLAGRKGQLACTLEGGRWLAHASDAGADAAAPLLEQIAARARPWPDGTVQEQEAALAAIAVGHPDLAARLALAARFDLDAREALFLDLHKADQGWCLLADVGRFFTYRPWRLVLVESGEQRNALGHLRALHAKGSLLEAEPAGALRTRMRRTESLLRHLGFDPALFIRDWRVVPAAGQLAA
jgi:TPR repeat protein